MSEKNTPTVNLTYEQAFAELEKIVASLENQDHTLEESLAQYERGQELARHCEVLLDQATLKVQQIAGDEMIPFENA